MCMSESTTFEPKITAVYHFIVLPALGFPCPEHNFVTLGPNHSKLGMHVSSNDLKCSAQEP